jgi:BirA family biotin operon repressor/biotin-[acetyl-CoA-carboxylase] ligase
MIIGSKLIFLNTIESTNTYASGLLKSERVPEGTIIYTNYQSAGRGQKDNKWESEYSKNLLFSIVLYPNIVMPADQFIISMFISLGIYDFLQMLIPECKIKWPNDIYAGDDKIAGILIENSITGNLIDNSVAGIGLNINQDYFPAYISNPVSLKMVTGKEYDTYLCLKQLAGFLDTRYKQLISGSWSEIRNDYISALYRFNKWHKFNSENREFKGRIISVDNSGLLVVEDIHKDLLKFSFKEIDFCI